MKGMAGDMVGSVFSFYFLVIFIVAVIVSLILITRKILNKEYKYITEMRSYFHPIIGTVENFFIKDREEFLIINYKSGSPLISKKCILPITAFKNLKSKQVEECLGEKVQLLANRNDKDILSIIAKPNYSNYIPFIFIIMLSFSLMILILLNFFSLKLALAMFGLLVIFLIKKTYNIVKFKDYNIEIVGYCEKVSVEDGKVTVDFKWKFSDDKKYKHSSYSLRKSQLATEAMYENKPISLLAKKDSNQVKLWTDEKFQAKIILGFMTGLILYIGVVFVLPNMNITI